VAAPVFQSWGAYAARLTAGAPAPPGAPASIGQGDILLLGIEDQGNDATTGLPTVSGGTETWTEHPSSPQFSSGATRLHVYWARASQASPTMPDIGGGVNHTFSVVARFTGGAPSGNPFGTNEYAGGNNAAANGTVPGFTVGGADRLCVFLASTGFNGTSSTRFSAWAENTTSVLSSITEIYDQTDTIGGGGGFGGATALITSGGTTSGMDFTEAFAGHGMISVALLSSAVNATATPSTVAAVASVPSVTISAEQVPPSLVMAPYVIPGKA